ncbi:fetal and adult testis-expressed transcript protein [Erethizon dorsatum]
MAAGPPSIKEEIEMCIDEELVPGSSGNLGIDLLAEIGLEELNGLEMEIIRRKLLVVTERLCALEDQDATWHFKEVVFFTMMVLVCIANLWLWMRQ